MWTRLLTLLLVLGTTSSLASASVFVQAKMCADAATASMITCTFDAATQAGNTMIVSTAYMTGTVTAITFSDNLGGHWEPIITQVGAPVAGKGGAMARGKVGYSGITTVTATLTNSETPDAHGLCLLEYRGINRDVPPDISASNSQTTPGAGTDAVTSTAVVTTLDREIVVGALWNVETVDVNISAGTNWTARAEQTTGAVVRGICEELLKTTAGSIAATGTLSSGTTVDTIAFVTALKNVAARTAISTARTARQ